MAERFDLDAIAADDALLDLLAAGGDDVFDLRHGDDVAVQLLAGLRLAVEDVSERPEPALADTEGFLARVAARNPVTDPLARKVAARGLALSVAAVAALSVSGVAAAVTGDPLAPYEKVIEGVVNVVRPKTTLPVEKLDGLVIGSKAKMVAAEYDYVTRHKYAKHGDEGDGTLVDPLDSRVVPPQQRDLARPPVDVRPGEPTVTPVEPTTTETTAGEQKSTPPTDPTTDQTTTETTPEQPTETTQPTDTSTTTDTTQPSDTSTTTPTGSDSGSAEVSDGSGTTGDGTSSTGSDSTDGSGTTTTDDGGAQSTDDSTTGSVPADPVATAEQVTATVEQVVEAATEALEQVATTVDAATSSAHTARHAAAVPVDSAGGIKDPALRAAVGHGSLAAHAR
ncbi:MAG TPA: hypothetical protein VGJ44_26230 [Kribbellaceae bacterium]